MMRWQAFLVVLTASMTLAGCSDCAGAPRVGGAPTATQALEVVVGVDIYGSPGAYTYYYRLTVSGSGGVVSSWGLRNLASATVISSPFGWVGQYYPNYQGMPSAIVWDAMGYGGFVSPGESPFQTAPTSSIVPGQILDQFTITSPAALGAVPYSVEVFHPMTQLDPTGEYHYEPGPFEDIPTLWDEPLGGTISGPASVAPPVLGVDSSVIRQGVRVEPRGANPAFQRFEWSIVLGKEARVRANIQDVSGRLVAQLVNGRVARGGHSLAWGGEDRAGKVVAAGVYYLDIEVDGHREYRQTLVWIR